LSKTRTFNLDMDTILTFGKHTGMDVSYLLDKQPGYLVWLLDKEVADHPDRPVRVNFSTPLMTAILDKIIDRPELERYAYLLPDEYTAEKRAEKRARELEQEQRAARYNDTGWGAF
jgi:hypothetical protein